MNPSSTFAVLMIALMFSAAACSLFPDRPYAPALHDFGSSEKITESQSSGSVTAVWSTVSVEAPEWLQNENIRYRLTYADPTRVRFYSRDRWLASPSAMLAQHLSLAGGKPGLKLKIKLLEFEQVFDGPQTARMILVFRASALQPAGAETVKEKVFSLSLPTATADAKGAVTAAAILINEALNALHAWFNKLPAVSPPLPSLPK